MHKVGALTLPAPAPAAGEPVGDPGLIVLAQYFKAILEKYLSTAWLSVAPGEPIVKTLSTDNPEESLDFTEEDLPLLCVWRDDDPLPVRTADSYQEEQDSLRILWVAPPTQGPYARERSPFFNAFKKAIQLAVKHERDPGYVHASDSARPANDPLRLAAEAYGSDVQQLAGVDWWLLRGFQRVPVDVPESGLNYAGYMATLTIAETNASDNTNAAWGTEPTVIRFDETTGGADPFTTQQALITGGFSSGFSAGFDGGSSGGFSRGFGPGFH